MHELIKLIEDEKLYDIYVDSLELEEKYPNGLVACSYVTEDRFKAVAYAHFSGNESRLDWNKIDEELNELAINNSPIRTRLILSTFPYRGL